MLAMRWLMNLCAKRKMVDGGREPSTCEKRHYLDFRRKMTRKKQNENENKSKKTKFPSSVSMDPVSKILQRHAAQRAQLLRLR